MTRTIRLSLAGLALVAITATLAATQEGVTSVSASEAKEYLGEWTLSVDLQGNQRQMDLTILEVEGKVAADLRSQRRPEPQRIQQVSLSDDGMMLSYEVDRGGNLLNLNLLVKLDGDELVGSLGDEGGRFSAPLTGSRKSAEATETASSPEPSSLDVAEAEAFLGSWALEMSLRGNSVSMDLQMSDVGGKLAAVLVTPQGEETITEIARDDDSLKLAFDSNFGRLTLVARVDGDALSGTFADENGQFSADFSGSRVSGDDAEERRRRARRRFRGRPQTRVTVAQKEIVIQYADPPADEAQLAQVEGAGDGQVLHFLEHAAIKLRTHLDLKFGDTLIKTENVAPDYPGVYSLWLKKVGEGWHLVFNELADVWGTQYSAESDVAEIPLDLSAASEPSETLTVKLTAVADGGLLDLVWGDHHWTTTFEVGP